jgi:hypothetical protein
MMWPSQDQPQQAEAQLPLRRERRLTGSVRTAAASRPGWRARAAARPSTDRGMAPMASADAQWPGMAGAVTDFPPVWTVYWAAKWQSVDAPGPCMTSRVYCPGQSRADRPDHRFPACMPDGHRMLAADASNWLLPRAKISLEWPFCHFYGSVRSGWRQLGAASARARHPGALFPPAGCDLIASPSGHQQDRGSTGTWLVS